MRIAYLAHWRGGRDSGPFKKMAGQAAAWEARGHEVRLFVGCDEASAPDWAELEVPAETVVAEGGFVSRARQRYVLTRLVAGWAPDVVYERFGPWAPGHVRLARQVPVVLEVNADDTRLYGDADVARRVAVRLAGRVLASARAIVTVSGELATLPRFRDAGPPVTVVSNGIDLQANPVLDPPPVREDGTGRLLLVGHPDSPWHGSDELARAARELEGWEVDIVGPTLADCGGTIPAGVHLHGTLPGEQYLPLLAQADAGIGSLAMHRIGSHENPALKVREYLARGLPVITACADPDIPADADWALRIPNEPGNVTAALPEIRAFVRRWQGRRVPRAAVAHLDVAVKEQQRLAVLERAAGPRADAPLRIAVFADGRSVHTHRWCRWFAARGHRVDLWSDTGYVGDSSDVELHDLTAYAPAGSRDVLGAIKRSLPAIRTLRADVARVHADVVVGHFLLGYGHLAASTRPAPVVLQAWGSDVYLLPTTSVRTRLLTKAALRRAAAVVGDSRDLVHALHAVGVPSARLHDIGFGVDVDTFRPDPAGGTAMRDRLGIAPDAPVVLSSRSVRAIYNIPLIAQAFVLVRHDVPDAVLVIKDYRGDADERARVLEILRAVPDDAIRWVEEMSHDELPSLIVAADVVVSMATSDSAPVSILEAHACGVPVIAGRIAGVEEWVAPALRTSFDARSIADAVVRELTAPEQADRSAALREAVVRSASVEREMGRAEGLLRSLSRAGRR
ncbi:MAG TPA: glycosyltransferase [Mycobacteriales bacterium]|nr:glycosyltransferase [Mycobacteriales bacterium]